MTLELLPNERTRMNIESCNIQISTFTSSNTKEIDVQITQGQKRHARRFNDIGVKDFLKMLRKFKGTEAIGSEHLSVSKAYYSDGTFVHRVAVENLRSDKVIINYVFDGLSYLFLANSEDADAFEILISRSQGIVIPKKHIVYNSPEQIEAVWDLISDIKTVDGVKLVDDTTNTFGNNPDDYHGLYVVSDSDIDPKRRNCSVYLYDKGYLEQWVGLCNGEMSTYPTGSPCAEQALSALNLMLVGYLAQQ